MKHSTIGRICIGVAASAMLQACMVDIGDEEALGVATEDLYGDPYIFWWPAWGGARVDINVCWENPGNAPGSTAQARANWRDERRRAVEVSWGRHARINFNNWDEGPNNNRVSNPRRCSNGEPGLHVRICATNDPLCPALPSSQAWGPGVGINLDGVNNGIKMNPNHGREIWVHEFGHALGFFHEEERPDAPLSGTTNCRRVANFIEGGQYYGAYDRDSVMAYCDGLTVEPYLSRNDIASIQRAYGHRVRGTLASVRGNCAFANYADGNSANTFLAPCNEQGMNQMFYEEGATGDNRNLYLGGFGGIGQHGKLCMQAVNTTSGSDVWIGSCSSNNNSTSWLFRNVQIRGMGGLCLDLTNGDTTNGTSIQMWECGALGGVNQQWSMRGDGLIRFRTTNKCVRQVNNSLVIWDCNATSDSQRWSYVNNRIRRASASNTCWDVQGPTTTQFINGAALAPGNGANAQTRSCNESINQRWQMTGQLRVARATGLCLTRAGNDDRPDIDINVQTCSSSNESQIWDYHF